MSGGDELYKEREAISAMFTNNEQLGNANINPLDTQIGGNHYKNMAIQPLEFFVANDTPFAEAAVCKYVLRHHLKGGAQDLEKAKHILDVLIAKKYGGANV